MYIQMNRVKKLLYIYIFSLYIFGYCFFQLETLHFLLTADNFLLGNRTNNVNIKTLIIKNIWTCISARQLLLLLFDV
jgi:hypothetical protein